MKEIPGWFPQESQKILALLIQEYDVNSVIEIGSFLGKSAAWFAKRVDRVTCVDLFFMWPDPANTCQRTALLDSVAPHCRQPNGWAYFHDEFKKNMIEAGVWGKISSVQGDSFLYGKRLREADLVYIDGDHSYEACLSDIAVYLPKATKVITGDDYDRPSVKRAVTDALPGHYNNGQLWWWIKCEHERLTEDGICRSCGQDRRGI